MVIEVLDKSHILCSFFAESRFTLFYPEQELIRRLYGEMRRIVSQVEEERLLVVHPFFQVLQSPVGEQISGMTFGINRFLVESHPVHPSPQVSPVVVHHIPQEAFKVVKSSVVGGIGGIETQVPLSDNGCVIASFVQRGRDQHCLRIEVAPAIVFKLSDDSRNPHHIRIPAGEQ